MKEIVITHGVRTPIGKIGGAFSGVSDLELASLVIGELVNNRAHLPTELVDHVILGEVRQSSDPSNIARVAALAAGIPEQVPAYTVHRQCGSGLQAIMDAYQLIACGEAEVVVAGGAESMSQSAYFMRGTQAGLGSGNYTIEDSLVAGGPGSTPVRLYGSLPMGITAENLASEYGISREAQDRFAQESQERMAAAMADGRFKEQIVPVEIKDSSGTRLVDTDEHPFLSTIEKISTLRPVFKAGGTVTAANSSGRNDGASAVLVMERQRAEQLGYQPLAAIRSIAASGCEPRSMGIGPVKATEMALLRAGITIQDLDVIELNEAFAAQSLAVIEEWKQWGISAAELSAKINPNGGAIAHGHPLGCTGTALCVKCLYELKRVPENRFGLISLCCAGGLGVSMLLEKLG